MASALAAALSGRPSAIPPVSLPHHQSRIPVTLTGRRPGFPLCPLRDCCPSVSASIAAPQLLVHLFLLSHLCWLRARARKALSRSLLQRLSQLAPADSCGYCFSICGPARYTRASLTIAGFLSLSRKHVQCQAVTRREPTQPYLRLDLEQWLDADSLLRHKARWSSLSMQSTQATLDPGMAPCTPSHGPCLATHNDVP
jgi:hypothetical protein